MPVEELIPEVMEAHVFRAQLRKGKKTQPPNPTNWDFLLSELKASHSLKERTVDGLIFDPISISGTMMLGIHKPISFDFMTKIDDESQDVGNYLSEDTDSKIRFAFSSLVMFTEFDHVFAMARGSRESPQHTAVAKFFRHFIDTPEKYHWVVEPYMAPDQLDELEKASGLKKFQTSFTTPRTLMDMKQGRSGVMTFAQQMSDAVGVELKLDLRVQIAKGHYSSLAARKLLELFNRDRGELTRSDSRAKAQAVLPGGVEEELNLVMHNMAFSFELPILSNEQKNFTQLGQGLLDGREELNNELRQNVAT